MVREITEKSVIARVQQEAEKATEKLDQLNFGREEIPLLLSDKKQFSKWLASEFLSVIVHRVTLRS